MACYDVASTIHESRRRGRRRRRRHRLTRSPDCLLVVYRLSPGPWGDMTVRCAAAHGGHLMVLRWAREHHCGEYRYGIWVIDMGYGISI